MCIAFYLPNLGLRNHSSHTALYRDSDKCTIAAYSLTYTCRMFMFHCIWVFNICIYMCVCVCMYVCRHTGSGLFPGRNVLQATTCVQMPVGLSVWVCMHFILQLVCVCVCVCVFRPCIHVHVFLYVAHALNGLLMDRSARAWCLHMYMPPYLGILFIDKLVEVLLQVIPVEDLMYVFTYVCTVCIYALTCV